MRVVTICRLSRTHAPHAGPTPYPEPERAQHVRYGIHPWIARYVRSRMGSPVDYLVGRLKFDCDLRVVPALAGLLVRAVGGEPTPDWLVPVPIGAARLRKRGFNQALELARYLGDIRGVRVSGIMRRRRGYETPQSSLPDTSARRANVAGAFEARAATRRSRRGRGRRSDDRCDGECARALSQARGCVSGGRMGGLPVPHDGRRHANRVRRLARSCAGRWADELRENSENLGCESSRRLYGRSWRIRLGAAVRTGSPLY